MFKHQANMTNSFLQNGAINLPDNICYIENNGYWVCFYFEDGTRFVYNSDIKSVEEVMPKDKFIRCSKSFIVNISKVQELWVSNETVCVMSCGSIIQVDYCEVNHLKNFLHSQLTKVNEREGMLR